MAEPKDPLGAATTAVLKPALSGLGFRALSRRSFGRVREGVLHYLDLQLSAWGSKTFAVNYAAITLYSPRDHVALEPGGRLPRGKSSDGWWSAKSKETATKSMSEVVQVFGDFCLPWLERAGSDAGLLSIVLERIASINRPKPHYLFDAGCMSARLGMDAEALSALSESESAFGQLYSEMPARTWCLDGQERCKELAEAIAKGSSNSVLEKWKARSFEQLKLARLS